MVVLIGYLTHWCVFGQMLANLMSCPLEFTLFLDAA